MSPLRKASTKSMRDRCRLAHAAMIARELSWKKDTMTTKPKTRRSENTPTPQTDVRELEALDKEAAALLERARNGDLSAIKEVADTLDEEAETFDTIPEAAPAKR